MKPFFSHALTAVALAAFLLVNFHCVQSPVKPADVLVNPIDTLSVVFTKPVTAILTGPANGETVRDAIVTFTYQGNADAVSFSWSADNGAWSAWSVSSSVTLTELDEGVHRFSVRALHRDGRTVEANPAQITFTVDAVKGPSIRFAARTKDVLFGETFNYFVIAEEVDKLYGASFLFTYDNTKITIQGVGTGNFQKTGFLAPNMFESRYGNKMHVDMFFSGGVPVLGLTGTDTILVLQCRAVAKGDSPFQFVRDSTLFRTTSNTAISVFQQVDGKVSVK